MAELSAPARTVRSVGDLVSFCVSNHNYGRYLRPLLEALLHQTHENVEIVVVDDGSTDESRDVLRDYEGRITVAFQDQAGQASACNRAFSMSRGDIVVFHDSDDVVHLDAASRLAEPFADPAVMMAMSRLEVVDANGTPTGEQRPPSACPLYGGDLRSVVLERCSFFWPETTGQAYRRSFLEATMPIPDKSPPDGYFSYLGALAGPVVAIDPPVASYRSHGRNKHLSSPTRGIAWLDERIERREVLYEAIRAYGPSVGAFCDAEAAAQWAPRDYIMAGLLCARTRLAHEPGRLRYARAGIRAIAGHPQFRLAAQLRHEAWFAGMAILPLALVRGSITPRFEGFALSAGTDPAGPTTT